MGNYFENMNIELKQKKIAKFFFFYRTIPYKIIDLAPPLPFEFTIIFQTIYINYNS